MKLTKKQIDIIREHTPEALRGTQPYAIANLGYYMPANANWSYRAEYIDYNGISILVVTRFGEVL